MALSDGGAASERLPDPTRRASEPALAGRLESHRDYLTILARMQIGRRLQGKVDVADVVQATFLPAVRDIARFRGKNDKELPGWLRQILAVRLADQVRRYCGTRGRDVRLEQALQGDLDQSSQLLDRGLVASISSPSQQAARHEQANRLANALERLPEDYREVLVLRRLEECGFPEAARARVADPRRPAATSGPEKTGGRLTSRPRGAIR
jgi:RNA polymerase sigma-70 factor (ECF subfamily)